MGTILPEEAERAVELEVTPTLNSSNLADALAGAAGKKKRTVKAHVKIDTGMGRFGTLPENAVEYVKHLCSLDHLEIEGAYTHFPIADQQDDDFTRDQIVEFSGIMKTLEESGYHIPVQHAANSSAIRTGIPTSSTSRPKGEVVVRCPGMVVGAI